MSVVPELADMEVRDLCDRLHREANARVVLVCGADGEIVAHAGPVGQLDDAATEAIGDATAEALTRAATDPDGEFEERARAAGTLRLCVAPLGDRAVLVVVFDDEARLAQVRLRMKRARDLILRSLDAS